VSSSGPSSKQPELRPPDDLIRFIGHEDLTTFEVIGQWYLGYFKGLCALEPDGRVLDIGCGVGRMAIPLTGFLTGSGSYEGLDIAADAVRWCGENITPLHPNFRFQLADVFNEMFNPAGKVEARNYTFPFDDGEFDLAFTTSVFTHMLPEDVERYFSEIARILKPGGRTLNTFFLLNEEAFRAIDQGRSQFHFRHDFGVYRVQTPDPPEAVVAYDEDHVLALHQRFGLEVEEPIHYGSWSGREGVLRGQDFIVARKAG
jgi:SAM-dependent methyltransferase